MSAATVAPRQASSTAPQDPAARSQLVPRERLVRRLLAACDVPLILLVAPAGYGKTTPTPLRQWEDREDRPFSWVGLDELDQTVKGLTNPTVVAVDDAHVYPTPDAREWLPSAVEALPPGSQSSSPRAVSRLFRWAGYAPIDASSSSAPATSP